MNWWIIEDALRDSKGHWREYLQSFRLGLEREGDSVRILASRECDQDLADSLGAEPLLPRSIWARISDNAPKWKKLLRIVSHGLATWHSVSRLLRANTAKPDLIFVPTVLVHHLVGWVLLLAWNLRSGKTRVLLFFPNTPAYLDADGTPRLNSDPSARLFAFLIRRCKKWVRQGRLILGAETEPMVAAMSQLTGVPFHYLPHAVEPMADLKEVEENAGATIRFGAYGSARHEKGSELIQAAILSYLAESPDPRVRFSLQWIHDFSLPDGSMAHLDPKLEAHPQCEVINGFFPEGGYATQIANTDVMILPYRDAYRLRVSRVVIEALQAGLPVIVARGTTLCQQAGAHGIAIECEQNNPASLVEAIRQAVEQISKLKAAAADAANSSREHFSVKTFRQLLSKDAHG
jgi:glycosyltransferase involved in cell wall biosynthesis